MKYSLYLKIKRNQKTRMCTNMVVDENVMAKKKYTSEYFKKFFRILQNNYLTSTTSSEHLPSKRKTYVILNLHF